MEFKPEVKEFFQDPHFMVLGTLRPNGTIQMTIVWFLYQEGLFKVSTTTERIKHQNLKKDPRTTFVIYDKDNPYRYVQVQGEVTDITKKGAHEYIDDLSQRYTGTRPYHGDPDHQEDRVIIRIKPIRSAPVGF